MTSKLAVLIAGATLALGAGVASASDVLPPRPPLAGGIPPQDVAAVVRSVGLMPRGPVVRRGPHYVTRAINRRGGEVRVLVDARFGDIVEVVPVVRGVPPRFGAVPPRDQYDPYFEAPMPPRGVPRGYARALPPDEVDEFDDALPPPMPPRVIPAPDTAGIPPPPAPLRSRSAHLPPAKATAPRVTPAPDTAAIPPPPAPLPSRSAHLPPAKAAAPVKPVLPKPKPAAATASSAPAKAASDDTKAAPAATNPASGDVKAAGPAKAAPGYTPPPDRPADPPAPPVQGLDL